MRIDLNQGPQSLPEIDRQNPAASSGSSAAHAAAPGADEAQFSGSHAQVQALVAQASQLPEVRQERVESLRQAVQRGQYKASAEQTAGAVFAHMAVGRARR